MATWWDVLPKADIFRSFLKDEDSKVPGLLTSTESDLFFWIKEKNGLLTLNLRKLHMQLKSEADDRDDDEHPKVVHQLLLCSKSPNFPVQRIQASPNGEAVLLAGTSDLMVMKMLKRRGFNGEFGGGHKEIVCATFVVEVYSETKDNALRRTEWLNSKEFIVLSADNILRKFSTTLPAQPVLSIGLSESVSMYPSISAPGLDWVDVSILDHSSLVCLRDSGDIHILRMGGVRGVELSDALPMYPAAHDNYTSEASVVLVLQTVLPIVVIATPTGEIHHCIMLPKTETSAMTTDCLVVFERLHLESDVIKDYGTVELLPDPTTHSGYLLRHAIGVHRIILPWADHMNMFMSNEDCSDVLSVKGQADVQYLLDVATSDPVPTQTPALCGVAVTWDSCIGNGLICIASDGTCVVYMLQPPIIQNASDSKEDVQESVESPRASLSSHESDFVKQISSQLRRDGGTALYHVCTQKTGNQEECFRAITDNTKLLTEDFLSKQDLALIDMDVKKKFLINFRQQQMVQLMDLKDDIEEGKDQFERLCDKLELVESKGGALLQRLKRAVCVLTTRSCELSNEEHKFKRAMGRMEMDIEKMQARIQLLKGKCKTVGYDLDNPPAPPTMTDSQLEYTRGILKEQMSTITEIISNMKILKACMSVVPGDEREDSIEDDK